MIDVWFWLVVLCWVLFLVLEGFDFGVGFLAPLLGRDEHERSAALRTIGPFWDGNEVWLVAAIGVTYAAFPAWYATLLSGTYLPVVLLLLLLAGRGVALEFRGKHDAPSWRRRCDAWLAVCSLGTVLVLGALLAVFATGLPLDASGVVRGTGVLRSVTPMLTWAALLGAAAAALGAALLGATFLALRTTGPVRTRARRVTRWLCLPLALGAVAVAPSAPWVACGAAVVALALRVRRDAPAFVATAAGVAAAVVAVFARPGPLLTSTLDPAWSLTADAAAASDGAFGLITAVGVVVLPGVVAYQAWSYWVFRRRVASARIPTASSASAGAPGSAAGAPGSGRRAR